MCGVWIISIIFVFVFFSQETDKRIALRQKKLAIVTAQAVEQIRAEVDAEVKADMLKNKEVRAVCALCACALCACVSARVRCGCCM